MDASEHDFANPTLMRSARGAYAQAIRAQIHELGVEDLPRNGAFILAGIDSSGGPRADLPAELGVTKQAVSQVIDVLVSQGYLIRREDPGDRRRVLLELTGRGQEVVAAVLRGVAAVDRELAQRVPPEQIEAMRSALLALTQIKVERVSTGTGRRPARPLLRRFSPIFPVRDLAAATAHYTALGFATESYDEGYGFAGRDGVGLQLSADPDYDGTRPGAAYLYVRDADALWGEWSHPDLGGHTHEPRPTPWQMREGSHTDPDGNLIRFGSRMR